MGLDITFFEHAVRLPPHEVTEACYEREPEHVRAYTWGGQFPATEYEVAPTGCWQTSGRTASWSSAYGGVTRFRAYLVRLARGTGNLSLTDMDDDALLRPVWAAPDPEMHFVELVNFADNEGSYGPRVAAELWLDFQRHLAEAEAVGGPQLDRYRRYMAGLELASRDGLVVYH